jgi:hypothetical protein
MQRFGRGFTACVLLSACACSLLVDTSELDAQCGAGKKYCEEKCVSVDEPFYGCTEAGCAPCPGDHSVHRCEGGECRFAECQQGWGCDACATNLLTTAERCGSCTHSCKVNEGETCSDGYCVTAGGDRIIPGSGGEGGGAP